MRLRLLLVLLMLLMLLLKLVAGPRQCGLPCEHDRGGSRVVLRRVQRSHLHHKEVHTVVSDQECFRNGVNISVTRTCWRRSIYTSPSSSTSAVPAASPGAELPPTSDAAAGLAPAVSAGGIRTHLQRSVCEVAFSLLAEGAVLRDLPVRAQAGAVLAVRRRASEMCRPLLACKERERESENGG